MVLVIAIVAALGDTLLWWMGAAGHLPLSVVFVLHLLLSVIIACTIFLLVYARGALLMIASGVLFMGPFGAAGAVAMVLFAAVSDDTDFKSYRLALGPKGQEDFMPVQRMGARSDRNLMSFHDVMRWGTRKEKQTALRRMVEHYSPAFASALKLAMHDPTSEIRSEAGAAAEAILTGLEARARTAFEKAAEANDKVRSRALADYGDAEQAIVRCGLASTQRVDRARSAALGAYGEARRIDPDWITLRLKTAKALFESGATVEAARESSAALEGDDPSGTALGIHLETLFALGRFADIRRILAENSPVGSVRRAAALWRALPPIPETAGQGEPHHA